MYNKPITQRVAFARGKKPSALKLTDPTDPKDTTVLKKEIPVVTDKSRRQLPDTTETITKPGKLTGSIAEPGGEKMPDNEWSDFCAKNPCNAACHKQFGECPDTEETIIKKGGNEEVETPRYQYDYGDSMPSYMQRKVYRGLEVGSRRTGKLARKAYGSMSDAERAKTLGIDIEKDDWKKQYSDLGIKNKRQFGKAVKGRADKKALNAAQAFAETQAEAARQGQTFGKQGTTKIGTFDPNVRISGEEGAVGRQTTMPDLGDAEEQLVNEKKRQDNLKAIENAKNQDAVNKRTEQQDTAEKDIDSSNKMKAGPLKMKSSFKMGGFGSKTYKK